MQIRKKTAVHAFRFSTQLNLVCLTGLRARNLKELLKILMDAPASAIYYHTHHFLKQHQFMSPEPPNDFAYWVTNVLQEEDLGEQLAAIDTVRFRSIHALGQKIIDVIESYIAQNDSHRSSPRGEEFHFKKSVGFVIPTAYEASNLDEFNTCIEKISVHSLYHHIFEARMRLEKENNDFSYWLAKELDEIELAKAIAKLDPYTQTLEGLRKRILELLKEGK
jgi:hypothetical protein